MQRDLQRTTGTVLGLGLATMLFACGGLSLASEFPGATPPLQTRLLGRWVSADGNTTLEYAWNGWLIRRTQRYEVKSSYRVDGESHYDAYDEQTRQWLRFKVDFTEADRMTLTDGAGERTEWQRGS